MKLDKLEKELTATQFEIGRLSKDIIHHLEKKRLNTPEDVIEKLEKDFNDHMQVYKSNHYRLEREIKEHIEQTNARMGNQ